MIFELIAGTYSQMPGWAQFLVAWPLPSLLIAQLLTWGYRKELANPHHYESKGVVPMVIFFSLLWPLAVAVLFIGAIIEFANWVEKKPEQIAKWFKNKHAARRRVKEYKAKKIPKASDSVEYVHLYEPQPKARTVCGVSKPSEVRKTRYIHEATCPLCLGIIKERKNGRT